MTPNRLRPIAIALALLPALAACASGAAAPSPSPSAPAPARPTIAAELEAVFNDTMCAGAFWGVDVRSQATGEVLYQRNPGKMLVPASNMKLVTAAAALEGLGPDYRYRTAVAATGPIANGELRGDLIVVGSGDPSISAQFGGDTRAVFRAWADSLRARGVTRVTGRVVGDDNAFDDVPLGAGWSWDDVNDYYSAEISALELNEGIIGVRVRPGASPGAPAIVTLDPPTAYVPVRSTVRTGAPGSAPRIDAVREPLGPGIVVSGQLASDTTAVTTEVAVRNNTAYFATVLRETLVAAGIAVRGEAVDVDSIPPVLARTDTLFIHRSPPMPEILAAFMKPSQNQIGEMLLKTLGRELRGTGTARAGIEVVDSLGRTWDLPRRRLSQADGSGLSRYNLVAPEFLIALLRHMERSPNRDVFVASLPVAGVDGTLANRMRGTPLQGNVRAKTGTVSNVRALSGYMTTAAGEPIVFSIIVNHHTLTSRDADRLAETALLRIHAMPRNR
jgi:serine-type D-Ala-D-Ala carboxypeptidase/endopeptidase (penicillin-binding protein 4)